MSTLQILEGRPEAWPTIDLRPLDLDTRDFPAAAVEATWLRIEQWVAWRWGARPCSFIVEGGCGSWRAPLHPFTATTVESWGGETWAPVTLPADPLGGHVLGSSANYRVSGTLGSTEAPPADVAEAFRRLAWYFHGVSTHSTMIGSARHEEHHGDWSINIDRAPSWAAKAIHNSGAADLLRPYRRAP